MAEPFARMKVLGTEVLCYLRPGTECDLASLVPELDSVCLECVSIDELQARMQSVADRHALGLEYGMGKPVSTDPYERVLSVGFFPRV